MFRSSRPNSLKTGLFPLFAAVILILSATTSATGSGKWLPTGTGEDCPYSSPSTNCSEGETCSEWDVDGEPLMTCCISQAYIGSSNLAACQAY